MLGEGDQKHALCMQYMMEVRASLSCWFVLLWVHQLLLVNATAVAFQSKGIDKREPR